MGCFTVKAKINGQAFDLVVDTGAHLSNIPMPVAEPLHLAPYKTRRFTLVDGSTQMLPIATAQIEINGETHPCPVTLGPSSSSVLLGATTLEIFMLGVDPINRKRVEISAGYLFRHAISED